jgi:Integrase zinc binding domain
LLPLIAALEVGEVHPAWPDVPWINSEARILWSQYESLEIDNGVLSCIFYRPDDTVRYRQIIMPGSLQTVFIQQLHERQNNTVTAHLGTRKTQEHIRLRAYWVGWRVSVDRWCRRYTVCQSVRHGQAPRRGRLQIHEAFGFGDRLHVDLTGPHPVSRQGRRFLMTAIDAYTRFLIVGPLRNKSAEAVAEALVEHVFLPFGA